MDLDFSVIDTPLPSWAAGFRLADPGWLYIVKNGNLLKIGKTKDPKRRLFRDAKTWLPDAEIIGVKPFWNISDLERILHCGIANAWYSGEWHRFPDESYSDFLIDGFRRFDDHDRNWNNVDLGYWINRSGMVELIAERSRRKLSLRKWQRELDEINRQWIERKGDQLCPPNKLRLSSAYPFSARKNYVAPSRCSAPSAACRSAS